MTEKEAIKEGKIEARKRGFWNLYVFHPKQNLTEWTYGFHSGDVPDTEPVRSFFIDLDTDILEV